MMSSDPASKSGSVTVKVTHVSDMARAKETADIIAATVKGLTNVELSRTPPNADLNEGRPCHIVPSGRAFSSESIRRDAPRIERAFRDYFYRHLPENWEGMLGEEERARKEEEGRRKEEEAARPDTKDHGSRLDSIERRLTGEPPPPPPPSAASEPNDGWFSKLKKDKRDARKKEKEDNPAADATVVTSQTRHEYSVIVCHGNVIRYFFMRALQLPPEAWLRLCTFNCSLTYFTIRPSGNVSCRTLGDIGHLDMERTTFSGHHGFNW
jgi:serine/threonine-protein phosphatase PGAM5